MVTITDSRIRNTVFETIYDLINSDKSSYNASSTPTLYGGFPDIRTVTFPIIVINPVMVNEDSYTVDTSRGVSTKGVVVVVEVYAKNNKDVDNIADGVSLSLREKIDGLFLTSVSEDNGFVFPNDGKLKQKSLTFSFVRR